MKNKFLFYLVAGYGAYWLYKKYKKPGYKITVPEPDILTEDQYKEMTKEPVKPTAQVEYVQPAEPVQVFTNPPALPLEQPSPAVQTAPVPVQSSALVNFIPSGSRKEAVSISETGVSTIQRPALNVAGNFPNYY